MGQILIFVALAALLASVEVIVPGGIFGVGAVILLGVAAWLAYEPFGLTGTLLTFIGGSAFVFLLLFLEFKLLGKTRLGKSFILSSSVSGQTGGIEADDSLVGKTGRALTTMAPTGKIEVDSRTYEASSRSGMIHRGGAVKVVGRESYRLIVEKA